MKDEVSSQNLRGERGEQFGLDSQAWLFNENMAEAQSLPTSRHSSPSREVNKRQRSGGIEERRGDGEEDEEKGEEEEEERLEP